jgi:hypothetical protein
VATASGGTGVGKPVLAATWLTGEQAAMSSKSADAKLIRTALRQRK